MESNIKTNSSFDWVPFYMEFADKLLQYKNNRTEILNLIKSVFDSLGLNYPFIDKGSPLEDICPFTVFGCFNKGITNANRISIMKGIGSKLGVNTILPTELDGIPVLNNMRSWFFVTKSHIKPDDIPNLWDIFEAGIHYADNPSEDSKAAFIACYDKVRNQQGIKWNLTVGLYWIRPFSYLNLDEKNRSYLTKTGKLYSANLFKISNLKQPPTAKTYLEMIAACKEIFEKNGSLHHSFPELSYEAWITSTSKDQGKKSTASFLKWFTPLINALKELGGSATPEQARQQIISDINLPDEIINETRGKTGVKRFDNEVAFARNYLAYEGYIDKSIRGVWSLTEKGLNSPFTDDMASEIFVKWADILKERRENEQDNSPDKRNKNEVRYWIYSPGHNAAKWEEFYSQGIMGIVRRDELGDLRKYPNKDAIKKRMKEVYGPDYSYVNQTLAAWQFANELQVGDIIYAKKGLSKVIGRGVVKSDYIFDSERNEYKHIRKINWTHKGEWEHPGKAAVKTLTEITSYTDYVQKLETIFIDDDNIDDIEEKEVIYDPYAEVDFLSEVFMDEESYNTLVNLLRVKKNIILQGAPGVGKTFIAKRLAYSIMGEKDTSRVSLVQFHQSYSYEDFMMGYRPSKDGFILTEGPFYQFCKIAQSDDERDYFFIIDEINRGNLSKIFGELLMLIEKEKRGEKMRLLYSNELFSVPKNVHIIGMMNTADRSLAMIDYALRRRFAFFELEPAFDSDGFKAVMLEANYSKFDALIEQIKALNDFISNDESLGSGFRIGHSYFCTNDEITDEWLTAVIKYELVPLLSEYWFDELSKIELWSNKLYGTIDD